MSRLLLSILLVPLLYNLSAGGKPQPAGHLHEVKIGKSTFEIGPQISKKGEITLYTLDNSGVFHRCNPPLEPQDGQVTYSVLKNGILIPTLGPYAIQYDISKTGDLIPKTSNTCVYKSEKAAFYLKGVKKMLIPVEVFYSGDQVYYVYSGNHLLFSEPMKKSMKNINLPGFLNHAMSLKLKPDGSFIVPDTSCSGDVTLFLLKSNGVFARNPPDEYLPNGMKLVYELKDDGCLSPGTSKKPEALELTYVTSENGNLKPCESNSHTLTTMKETTKSFILGAGGVLAPVSEVMGINKTINYFFDGQLIHSSNQFQQLYSNSSVVYVTERTKNISKETEIDTIKPGPKFFCSSKKISKRETRDYKYDSRESAEEYPRKAPVKPYCTFAYDDGGKRIVLEPLINDCGKIAIYKLTCKGHLKRMEAHKEPEWGFEVHFKLLDNCIMVPTIKNNGKICIKYILQENGNLAPMRHQKFTFKKAPASVLYYVLAKNKELLPVRLNILKSNHIEIYYQDCLIHTMAPECAKNVEVFTTLYAPLYAYLNGYITIIHSDPIPKPCSGSTWNNPSKTDGGIDYPCKNLYLVGPNQTRIKIEPDLNHNGVPVIFEMDWNGVCHKSPKDDNKNMILKSYKLLKEFLLIPTNETNGYIYLIDKQGNMVPYCYPETKLRAPYGLTVKYVLCKGGLLLPVLVEAPGDHIRFSYETNVIYFKRAYTIEEIVERSQDWEDEDIKYYKEKDGSFVYYEKIGECFHRHPCQKIEHYMVHSLGYMKLLPCGTLIPLTYPDPTCDSIKIQVEDNGNLCIVSCSGKKPAKIHYLLTENRSLVPVEIKKKDGYCRFYRNGARIGKQKMDQWGIETSTSAPTPSGEDPMGIFKDPEPEKGEEKDPHYVSIPISETKQKDVKNWTENDFKKCDQIRKTIKELMAKDKSPDLVLEMTDSVMEELYKMVCACAKTKDKREILSRIQRHLTPMQVQPPSIEDELC